MIRETLTTICRDEKAVYPMEQPFHPATPFPEYPWPKSLSQRNDVYSLVRQIFHEQGLDAASYGKPEWNPLGSFIRPGQTVFLKPNMVLHEHPRHQDLFCLITHGSVIRAVLDYVFIALKGKGKVIIADSPLQTTDFDRVTEQNGLKSVVDFYRKTTSLDLTLIDLRQVQARRDINGHIVDWREQPGDPTGYVTFNLGNDSMLAPIEKDSEKFRVSNYKSSDTAQYHLHDAHRYVLARSALEADVIIDLPKMKTHCKVGITVALKNFVGLVGRKQCLAHHREGGAGEGGDEYPGRSLLKKCSEKLERCIDGNHHPAFRWLLKQLYRVNERVIRELRINPVRDGGWYGNDTAWRMTLDLARIVAYGKTDGTMAAEPQRVIFTLVDGVVAGENEGPLEATPKRLGLLISGFNPVAVDLAAAELMGFDYQKIPLLSHSLDVKPWPLISATPHQKFTSLHFAPPYGWKNHIERV